MKEWGVYIATLLICISLQSVWPMALWFPPVWMLVLFFVATRKSVLQSLVFSYLAGFLWCVFTGISMGLACSIVVILSLVIGPSRQWVDLTPHFISLCAVLGVLWQVLYVFLSYLLESTSLSPNISHSIISSVLMTVLAGPMAYFLTWATQNKEPDLHEVTL